ncbi:hypothetical protein GFS31_12670 [Leptolyngbya sp. BL0902]|uniref:hypothetical protein n=1 Tax=Leptolyngbya sp. BL0902 TaxID=1115757 RepID=UPI0018E83160|nr:hypothetical protein [Leptolyngbya sp. BL0902]QQE64586.1 hypothetical protein GFS31_12670 [Leptolyngbya sp. BL0902]
MSQKIGQALRQAFGTIGSLGLAIGLLGCGEAATSLGQSAGETAISPSAAAAGSPRTALVSNAFDPAAYSIATIDAELERMMLRDCLIFEEQQINDTVYLFCAGANDQPLRVEMGYPDGPVSRYWFHDDGQFYAHEDYFDGNFTRKVLADDGKTIVFTNSQGEWEAVDDIQEWQDTIDMVSMAITTVRSELGLERGEVSSSQTKHGSADILPVGMVKLARTGGDFNHRWATLVVPQPGTAVSAEGGAMRWYDLHLATMVALTADQFCGNPSARGAYFNYEADGGSVYMGQYFIPCNTAKELMDTFGRGRQISVEMEEGGFDLGTTQQAVPALPDSMMAQFRRQVVDVLTPECSDGGLCPGDRI